MSQKFPRTATRVPSEGLVDPRTDLPQADIPPGLPNFDSLRHCIIHWFSECALVSGGSQRTEPAPAPVGRNGKPQLPAFTTSFSDKGKEGELEAHSAFTFILVISDSCLYVLDRAAVVIRCLPIVIVARILVLELVAKDTRSTETIRSTAARSGMSILDVARDMAVSPPHRSSQSSPVCFSVLGFGLSSDTSSSKEHDCLIGVPLGAVDIICAILLRIHWAHLGPNVKLPIEVIDVTPVRTLRQAPSTKPDMQQQPLPIVSDVLTGIDDAAIPPLLGLDTQRTPHWELHVEPFRRWVQLELLLKKKQATLVDQEVAIEAAFRRIKASLTEHASYEERERWRLLAMQNQQLADTVQSLERQVAIAKKLIEQEIPGGLDLLLGASISPGDEEGGRGAAGTGGRSLLDTMGSNALFSQQQVQNNVDHAIASPSSFFSSPRVSHAQQSAKTKLASPFTSFSDLTRAHASSVSAGGGSGRCTRCRELEYLMESHPNVDKIRILKAEEALVSFQHQLQEAGALMTPLKQENAELRDVVSRMMRELVHANESEAKLRRKQSQVAAAGGRGGDASSLYGKSFEVGVRNAIRTGEPFYRIEALDETILSGAFKRGDNTQTLSSGEHEAATVGDQVRQWRLLCSEMERRHRRELKDLYLAFTMYDDIMTQSVQEALRQYEPNPHVNLAQATSNILSVAKSRAREAKSNALDPSTVNTGDDGGEARRSGNSLMMASPSSIPYIRATPPPASALHAASGNASGGSPQAGAPRYNINNNQQMLVPGPLDSVARWADL
jgi:hypothetical protein